MKDDLPTTTTTTSSPVAMAKKENTDSSPFGKTRYKFRALVAILLLAFWSMFTGTITLKWSAGNLNHYTGDIESLIHDDLDILVCTHISFPLYFFCFSCFVLLVLRSDASSRIRRRFRCHRKLPSLDIRIERPEPNSSSSPAWISNLRRVLLPRSSPYSSVMLFLAIDFLDKLLRYDQQDRLTAREAMVCLDGLIEGHFSLSKLGIPNPIWDRMLMVLNIVQLTTTHHLLLSPRMLRLQRDQLEKEAKMAAIPIQTSTLQEPISCHLLRPQLFSNFSLN